MKPAYRGIAVAIVQCLIALSAFGKYEFDRERLPRVWVKAAPYDPKLPLRGRYVSLRLEVEADPAVTAAIASGHLSVREGHLYVASGGAPWASGSVRIVRANGHQWSLMQPVAFFLPEHADDPSRPPAGKELWLEVSVPRKGPPRPIQIKVEDAK